MSQDSFDPYRPPIHVTEHVRPRGPKPPVVGWLTAYCVFMGILYLCVAVAGAALAFFAPADLGEEIIVLQVQGGVFCIVGIVLAVVFFRGAALPRKPWAWIYGMVLICIGLTSPCCLPASVPLLISWIKEDTKKYFGRD